MFYVIIFAYNNLFQMLIASNCSSSVVHDVDKKKKGVSTNI